MQILFVHQNFPAQFRHLVAALRQAGGRSLAAIGDTSSVRHPSIRFEGYSFKPPLIAGRHEAYAPFVRRSAQGEAAAGAMQRLKQSGFVPDLVVGHPGWGELLYLHDVWPDARLVAHAEYYYSASGADIGFDPEFPPMAFARRMALRARNAVLHNAIVESAVAVAPTWWQASRFPSEFAGKIRVIHEGIDTGRITPNAEAHFSVNANRELSGDDEVITFASRNLEPLRGFHIFMRALPEILSRRPAAHAVIVGGSDAGYGLAAPTGTTWREKYFDEVRDQLPLDRVHFTGTISHQRFLALMQISRLHVYLTYPFVLSWSMLEAMSAGALVLASNTPPVTEVIEGRRNGLLFDFFDVRGLAANAVEALANPGQFSAVRQAARETIISRFDLDRICLPAWLQLIAEPCRSMRT